MKIIKKILSSILYSLIFIIEFFEYFFYKESVPDLVFDSQKISDISILSDTGYEPLSFIHQGKRDYIYTIKFANGLSIRGADDHPLILADYSEKKIIDIKESDTIRTINGLTQMISRKKSWFKYAQLDVTVSSINHRYFADGILVHNCVTFDTMVNVYDKTEDKWYNIPIYEVHYRFKENMSWWDKLEYFLYKKMFKIKGKIRNFESRG